MCFGMYWTNLCYNWEGEKVPGSGVRVSYSSNIPMPQVWAFPERPGNLWTLQSVKDLSGTWLTERYLPTITVCGNDSWRHRHLQFHGLWSTLSVEVYIIQCYCHMRTNFTWRQRALHLSNSSLMSSITLLDQFACLKMTVQILLHERYDWQWQYLHST